MRRAWLLYLLLIFGLSSIPGTPHQLQLSFRDKYAHFILYGGYGFLIAFGGGRTLRWGLLGSLAMGFLAGAITGAADEFYQSFIPNRESDVFDWLADTLGCTLGVLPARLARLQNMRKDGWRR